MSLKRSSVTGHLLLQSSGHLAKECCCTTGTPPCGCTPPLDFAYTITIYGFATADDTRYAGADGDWDVEWTTQCTWVGRHSYVTGGTTRYFILTLDVVTVATPVSWRVTLQHYNSLWVPITCALDWRKAIVTSPCVTTPPGSTIDYVWFSTDGLCAGDADSPGQVTCAVA